VHQLCCPQSEQCKFLDHESRSFNSRNLSEHDKTNDLCGKYTLIGYHVELQAMYLYSLVKYQLIPYWSVGHCITDGYSDLLLIPILLVCWVYTQALYSIALCISYQEECFLVVMPGMYLMSLVQSRCIH